MAAIFESDGPRLTRKALLLRGTAFLLVIIAAVTVLIMKSQGTFEKSVAVTVVLGNVGDGLPPKSDVKYRGVLVGIVDGVTGNGSVNDVHVDLTPAFADKIPRTVTARVVPSNVFAVPSIQLVDNGAGRPLTAGARIPEDRSLDTIRLQTTLTQARAIVAAAGRADSDDTLGMLRILADATDRRGETLSRAGSQLDDIVSRLNEVVTPRGGRSTLAALSTTLGALSASTPDILDTLHHSIVPLRAVAEQKVQLKNFLTGGIDTAGTIGTAMENNTAKLITITTRLSPVIGVIADGSPKLTSMTSRLNTVTTNFAENFWNPKTQLATAKVIVSLTPTQQYTRADCPRYGDLAGPSCATAPLGQPALPKLPAGLASGTITAPSSLLPPALMGGNVGPVGSAAEQRQIAGLLGGLPNAASDLLFGMLARGSDVTVTPDNGPTR